MTSLLIQFLRKIFDASGRQWDDYGVQIFDVCNFASNDWKKWNFIIDSLYLIEDVQLAKENFARFNLSGPTKYEDLGEKYLRLYGIYNACYLEKQAIFKITKILNIPIDADAINRLSLFEFRKCFGSHTVNVGHKEHEHSYILDRTSLSRESLEGYSSNTEFGHRSIKGGIGNQITEWNGILDEQLFMVCQFVLDRLKTVIGDKASNFETAFSRIIMIRSNEHAAIGYDIWADDFPTIKIISSQRDSNTE